jgi:DNA-binding Lrp family transcriptional regulator
LTTRRDKSLPLRVLKEVASPFHSAFGSYLRPTYSDVAKKLAIDEETARLRLRQAQRAGTILGWRLAINPHILSRNATSVMLEVKDPSSKQSMISEIKLIDEVILIMDFYDKPLRVIFCHESDRDRERRLDLIESICGDKNPISWQVGFAPCNVSLKKTDWEILKVLRRDLMQSNTAIANELKVSSRTIRRRLAFMKDSRAIYTFAVGNVMKVPGMAYLFLVDSSNERKKRDVDEEIISRLENAVFVDTNNKQYSLYAAVFHNMAEASETHRWIKSLDGAENTRMSMMREIISVPDWFDKEIEKHVKESS